MDHCALNMNIAWPFNKVIERIKMPKRGGGELGFSKNLSNL